MIEVGGELAVEETPIEGLLVVRLAVHGDDRGWFKEHWQREKLVGLGLPDFGPVQQNVSFNAPKGVTRGLHAEPWDKYVSVANGRALGVWVDLREGAGFGRQFQLELRPEVAVFVPRGVANGFQTLTEDVNYMYLVNEHWSADARYTFVNLADPELKIAWPIPLDEAVVSEKDRHHPLLSVATPMPPKETVVLGANGQLGRALRVALGEVGVRYLTRADLDVDDPVAVAAHDWTNVATIINATAFTAVDSAETDAGRRLAWATNATALRDLARVCLSHDMTLVTVSTDYVFDGTEQAHAEDEALAPLNAYGASKAAGELVASLVPKHYIVRTSWVVGDGANFVRTMERLANSETSPAVIDDQHGRLTFADDLAGVIGRLLSERPEYGIYHFSNSGPVTTWHDIAREVFRVSGQDPDRVRSATTAEYARAIGRELAPRPVHSAFSLAKVETAGLLGPDAGTRLVDYLQLSESQDKD